MIGDGYTSPMHCEFANITGMDLEPDANPVYCNYVDESKLLFQQDDCAPDSFQSFEKSFIAEVGCNVYEFKEQNKSKNDFEDDFLIWGNDAYQLEYHCDDPFYKLYKL